MKSNFIDGSASKDQINPNYPLNMRPRDDFQASHLNLGRDSQRFHLEGVENLKGEEKGELKDGKETLNQIHRQSEFSTATD